MNTSLMPVPENPGTLITRATDVAGVCAEIVKRTARMIQGRKYVQVEGWQSIAAAYGCVASAKNVERIEGGVRAIGELHRISDGALIATAVGFVGEDEPVWYGGEGIGKFGKPKTYPKRPDFAIQAMAQTRSISRVCRSAFAFVVVLIDENLSTTPAEEMMGVMPEEPVEFGAPRAISANAGAGDDLDENTKRMVQETYDHVVAALDVGKDWDAYSLCESLPNEDPGPRLYIWSLLSSSQRSRIKKQAEFAKKAAAAKPSTA